MFKPWMWLLLLPVLLRTSGLAQDGAPTVRPQENLILTAQVAGDVSSVALTGSYAAIGLGQTVTVLDIAHPTMPVLVGRSLALSAPVVAMTFAAVAPAHVNRRDQPPAFLYLVTGATREESLTDTISEFGMMNADYATTDYRYAYAATGKPNWFLFDGLVRHDLHTGAEEHYCFGDGVFASETSVAPKLGATSEEQAYLVTITTDLNNDASYGVVFDAARVADGPICQVRLPERVSSGTHSTWAPGSELRRWRTAERAADAVTVN